MDCHYTDKTFICLFPYFFIVIEMDELEIRKVLDEAKRWLYGEALRLLEEHYEHIVDRCKLK